VITSAVSSKNGKMPPWFRKVFTMDTKSFEFHRPAYLKWGNYRLATLALILVLVLPMTASAASFWCVWFPWWPLCGNSGGGCGERLTEVSGFGSNPGNLTMCTYVPENLETSRPLVVALNGCNQQAADYDDETGWIKFADRHQFALLLPQQKEANNMSKCFNWFALDDIERDQGEALSIRQMVDKMAYDNGIDPQKVYVTGLSAGGGMAAVMLATYPDVFAGGAIIAGIPYRCATTVGEALGQCGVSLVPGQLVPMKDLSPDTWGNLVRNSSNHNGSFPRVSIWQGTNDTTVNPADQQELVDQWTNVSGIDQTPDIEDTINGHEHKLYKNDNGDTLVETVLISGMGHGTPIDPRDVDDPCGSAAPFILDVRICSSFHIIKFWGLDSQ
jgi:poly(hydroxyalkanoate) depolymerase family esterase